MSACYFLIWCPDVLRPVKCPDMMPRCPAGAPGYLPTLIAMSQLSSTAQQDAPFEDVNEHNGYEAQ